MADNRLTTYLNWFQDDMRLVQLELHQQQVKRLYFKPEPWMDAWRVFWCEHLRCAYAYRQHRLTGQHQFAFPDRVSSYVQQLIRTHHLNRIAA